VSFGIRRIGASAGVGIATLASAMICTATATAEPTTPVPPPPPPAPGDPVPQAAAAPGPVPHLSSPQNLPPGTSDTPDPDQLSPGGAYAHSIWEAIQNHDITWRQGLVLLAQRPMNANATPPPGLSAGPQQSGPADAPPPPPPPPPWLPTP
jgi:hypothetical protein